MRVTSNMCPLLCCGSIHVTALYTVKLFRSSLLISCLLWAGKDFAKTLKTILVTQLTYSICFQKMHLYISTGFVYQGFTFFLLRVILSVHEAIFLQVMYPYNDCLGKTTELRMLCLVSESCSVLIIFFF